MRRGQVALYLLMVIVALFLLAVMNVDVFLSVRSRDRLQNGGDAAALAAARKQGSLLNEIGKLNLRHLAAAIGNDAEQCAEIVMDQRRLALLGPIEALRDANEAAKRNGMRESEDFENILRDHVTTIRTVYDGGTGSDGEPFPEPWEGAWTEYAAAIENALGGGLATGPDNMAFYDALGGHLLLTANFYHAIAGKTWCWFHFNAESTLKSYSSWHDWSALPMRRSSSTDNCEIFSLHVRAVKGAIADRFSNEEILSILEKYGEGETEYTLADIAASTLVTNREDTWFLYDDDVWRKWYEISPSSGNDFPVVGKPRAEYDVMGCAAVCRCVNDAWSVMSEDTAEFVWSAAAKPFGTVETEDGVSTANALNDFIVPCFNAVRLIPLDATGGACLGTADAGWVAHIREHLPEYLQRGPRANGCWWCDQLIAWERASFRNEGVRWLKYHAGTCVRGGGGPGGHGGTSHGH